LQKQTSESAKQDQNGFGRKIEQIKKPAGTLRTTTGRQILKNKPKMRKFTQKHAQIAFCSTWKQKKCHKIKKSNPQNRNLQKSNPKTSNFQIKQARKQAAGKSSRNPAIPQKNIPKFAGITQGWQHCPP